MTTRLGIRLLFAALLGTFAVASQAAQVPSSTDQPKEDLPTIIQSFRAATLTRDSLGSVLDSTSGVSRDYAQELLAQRDDDIRASALAFANAVEELSGEGLDVADARRSMSDAVNEDWPRYQSQLKKRTKDLARLNRDSDALSGAERVAIETEMSEQSDQLLRAYQSLVDVTLALEGAGVDVSKQRKFLVDGLPAAAEGLVTRVQLAGRARANALARLSRDASSADLRFMLEASDERLRRASAGLSMAILLMDRLRLPTTALRVSRITTTGKLSADVFQWPVFWGLVRIQGAQLTDTLWQKAPGWLFQGMLIVLTFLLFRAVAGFVERMVERAVQHTHFSQLRRRTSSRVASAIVMLIGFVVILTQLGVQVAPLLAGFGVAGVVIGFAMQNTLSNFAAGGMIISNQPFDIGDDIEVAGVSGVVKHMNLVSTTILTPDNQTLVIPNSSVWGGVIRNQTTQPNRRVDLTFGIGYEDDIEKAERVLRDIVVSNEHVLRTPEPVIRLHQLADSSVNFVVRVWTAKENYWSVYWDLTRAVKLRFDQEGITIPFPQRQVHMRTGKTEPEPAVASREVTPLGA